MEAKPEQGPSSSQTFSRQGQGQGRYEPGRGADERRGAERAPGSMGSAAPERIGTRSRQAGSLRESVSSIVERGTVQVADQADATARALHGAADKLEQETPQAAQMAHTLAGQIDRASSYLRDRRSGQILSDIEGFARREPAMFIAGAALAGVLLGRFLRASRRSDIDDYGYRRGSNRPPNGADSRPLSTGPLASGGSEGFSEGLAGTPGEL
jgi:hypothetical protein